MELPQILLNGVSYYVDHRLRECRRCTNPHDKIDFDQFKDEGEFFSISFIRGADNQLTERGRMYDFGVLVRCHVAASIFVPPIKAEPPHDADYACIWGCWEPSINSYKPNVEIRKFNEFSEDEGYEPEDLDAIRALEPGDQHENEYGNHIVMRIS